MTNSLPKEKIFSKNSGWFALAEILLIFLVFFVYGAWPVPDVNEQYYIGKAIHFWHPDWLASDNFLGTPDSHWLYYAVFGVFSLIFDSATLAWFGRCLIWILTAWSWRALSRSVIPRQWFSVLTALGFVFFLDTFHLAGEWIIGGVEGKGFAFPFIFWGLGAFLQGRTRICWVLWGIASAFHVLAGGWTVLAALLAWTLSEFRLRKNFRAVLKSFRTILPALCLGGVISLFGLIPALMLDSGANAETIRQAHRIYVYERLAHHLVPSSLPWTYLLRFLLLAGVWALFCRLPNGTRYIFLSGKNNAPFAGIYHKIISDNKSENTSNNKTDKIIKTDNKVLYKATDLAKNESETVNPPIKNNNENYHESCHEILTWRLNYFILASLIFMTIGFCLDFGVRQLSRWGMVSDPKNAADLLRFYWFRLSDWAIPLGVALGGAALFLRSGNVLLGSLVRNSKRKNPDQLSIGQSKEKTIIRFLILLIGAIGVYVFFKEIFSNIAQKQALAATVDPNYPVPARPVEGVAFITSFFTCAFLCQIMFFCGRHFFLTSRRLTKRSVIPIFFLAGILTVAAPFTAFFGKLSMRTSPVIPRSNPQKESISNGWIETCHWIRDIGNTPSDSVFLVPCGYNSFKWYAERAEAAAWKEIPQDARSIVQWYNRVNALYAMPNEKGSARWNQPLVIVLIAKGRNRVLKECTKYGIDYIVIENPPYTLTAYPKAIERWQEFVDNDIVWQNSQFTVLCFKDKKENIRTSDEQKSQ